jgi:IS30 family transposase
MGRCYPHLNLEERRKLAKWLEAKIPVKEIADNLQRAPSTIYREIRRNTYSDTELPQLNGYHAMIAQDQYEKRRAVHRKLIRHPEIMAAVRDGFDAGWSPEQIAGRMKLERHPMRVSHETIYRYAYFNEGRAEKFYRHLPEHRRPRGTRKYHGRRFLEELAIAHRPEVIADRDQFGHSLPGRRLQSNLPRGGVRLGDVPQGVWESERDIFGRAREPVRCRVEDPGSSIKTGDGRPD